jgi:hypothetical protein
MNNIEYVYIEIIKELDKMLDEELKGLRNNKEQWDKAVELGIIDDNGNWLFGNRIYNNN